MLKCFSSIRIGGILSCNLVMSLLGILGMRSSYSDFALHHIAVLGHPFIERLLHLWAEERKSNDKEEWENKPEVLHKTTH